MSTIKKLAAYADKWKLIPVHPRQLGVEYPSISIDAKIINRVLLEVKS